MNMMNKKIGTTGESKYKKPSSQTYYVPPLFLHKSQDLHLLPCLQLEANMGRC